MVESTSQSKSNGKQDSNRSKRRSSLSKILPTDRLSFSKQVDILRAAAVASATSGSVAYMAFLLAVDTRRRGREWLTVSERAVSRAFICRSARSAVLFSVDLHRPVRLLAVAVVLACAAAAAADDDHARARAAREAGEIVSLQAILDRVHAEFNGSPVEIELDDDDGRLIYKVKLLAPGGAIVKLEYDARDARLLRAKGRAADAARRPRQE